MSELARESNRGITVSGWVRATSLVLLLLSFLFLDAAVRSAPAASPESEKTQPATADSAPVPQPTLPAEPAPVKPVVNPVTQAAVQSGVLACISRINQVVTFLTANCKSHAFLFVPNKIPDQSIFSVSLSTQTLDGITRYASASFAPTTSGQAAAVYDTVEYVEQPPDVVEKSVFKNLKRKGTLGKDGVILDGGPVTIFLMPAGSGSLVIRKEVVQ